MTAPLTEENTHRRQLRGIELREVLRRAHLTGHVMELGAGAGWQAQALRREGVDVVALDLPGTRYRTVQVFPVIMYDGVRLPVRDGSMDGMFSSHVLEHVEELPELMRDVARALKPGAHVVAVLPSPTWRALTILTKYATAGRALLRATSRRRSPSEGDRPAPQEQEGPGTGRRSKIWRLLVPRRHGARGSAVTELYLFSPRAWRRRMAELGWTVEQQVPLGLAYSGNHFLGSALSPRARSLLARGIGSSSFLLVLVQTEPGGGRMRPAAARAGSTGASHRS